MLPRAQFKARARTTVSAARVSAYGMTLVYLLITGLLNITNNYISGAYVTDILFYFPELELHLPDWLLLSLSFDRRLTLFYSVMVLLITSVLSTGYYLYHLTVRRGEWAPFTTLFDGFSFVGKIVVLQILMTALMTLGFMCFLIPGVIMVYRYRYAIYNLCENPNLRPLEVMRMSSAQTKGRKWELFVLDLSFLGWNMLAAMTLGILNIWVQPYFVQTDLEYFEACKRSSGVGTVPLEGDGSDQRYSGPDPFGS